MKTYRVGGASTTLLIGGAEARDVRTYIVISEYTDEPMISDQLVSEFGSGRRPRQRSVET
jgi:hypothetical protein